LAATMLSVLILEISILITHSLNSAHHASFIRPNSMLQIPSIRAVLSCLHLARLWALRLLPKSHQVLQVTLQAHHLALLDLHSFLEYLINTNNPVFIIFHFIIFIT
jgi:hypothetical protein